MNAADDNNKQQGSRRARALLEFLGSMNLAITLLVTLAIASIIGTVLQQNQPYTNYLGKFGPFWFEIFERLGLYDIYGSSWFLGILAFLLVSVSVCVYRNAPSMLREVRGYRLKVQEKSLRSFHNHREWELEQDRATVAATLQQQLQHAGYRSRVQDHGDHLVLAAKRGTYNRLGYIFAHSAIVVICLGALLDGNLPLKLRVWSGDKQIETRDVPASEVPETSYLDVNDSLAFRGNINLPEGSRASIIFLNMKDGYLVQRLPFTIELKDFRVEHYSTGQPKSFESDLVIHDSALAEPLAATISVNHPLVYRGHAIYQANFGDGGSKLQLRAWSLKEGSASDLEGEVLQHYNLSTPEGKYSLELNDFRLFNINEPPPGDTSGKKKVNYGPSYIYKLRDEQGQAREYDTFMAPLKINDRFYFISGMREEVGAPMRYLHIPADQDMSIDLFMRLRAALADGPRVNRVVTAQVREMGKALGLEASMQSRLVESLNLAVAQFRIGGYDAVTRSIPADTPGREQKVESLIKVLHLVLTGVYFDVLDRQGIQVTAANNAEYAGFLDEAINTMAGMHLYGSPLFLQLSDFKQVQSSGLQITRSPGKNVVYLGCVLLIIGVFFMFYIHHRRIWVWMVQDGARTRVVIAGSGDRDQSGFSAHFTELTDKLEVGLRRG